MSKLRYLPLLLLLLPPFYLDLFWLQAGLFVMAAAIGAIGLNLLTGSTGQLSMGHSFFLAVGAYGYVYFAGESDEHLVGLGLPPVVAIVCAVVLAGLAGLAFSPIAGRLSGVYLGIASLALIFIGQHVLFNVHDVTGGYNGRAVPPLEIFGFTFDNSGDVAPFGIPFGGLEKLWFVGLILLGVSALFALGVLRSRPGRAMNLIRDQQTAAGVIGIPVARTRAAVFTLSSMYAGLGGVLLALTFQRAVPDYFGMLLALDYLAMIVIGGLGSVTGAIVGATFVTLLPQLLTRYSDSLPLVSPPGTGGVSPADAARYLYGAAVVGIVLFLPAGLRGLRIPSLTPRKETTP
ncbi:branched-chain amino acid ABC transporter permease [Actinocorallia sp. API 0066]|uniref:branched-chain amino acid ABC transporter permease n=1 Tax=Actinocorallia sp. API 0066 TaxID=2896846 RepID=UPI001E3745D6|nr:branched-chain amino acid ABC transporter permease [Actinocorallia sp. API 0066]MCD0452315.1 branched-chain amino acid ABC transporter permease [Actinocorallia sp. API 0066]